MGETADRRFAGDWKMGAGGAGWGEPREQRPTVARA